MTEGIEGGLGKVFPVRETAENMAEFPHFVEDIGFIWWGCALLQDKPSGVWLLKSKQRN